MFVLVEAERAGRHSVAKSCVLLEVPRSADCAWSKHVPSPRSIDEIELGECIEAIHADS